MTTRRATGVPVRAQRTSPQAPTPSAPPTRSAPRAPDARPSKYEAAQPAPGKRLTAQGEYSKRKLDGPRVGNAQLALAPTTPRGAELPERADLELIFKEQLDALRDCSSAARDGDVPGAMKRAARSLLLPGWDPETFHDVTMAAAKRAEKSSAGCHLDTYSQLLVLRAGALAHETGAKLPEDISRRLFRAVADNAELLLGKTQAQEALVGRVFGGELGAAADLAWIVKELIELRELVSTYDLKAPISGTANGETVEEIRSALDNVRDMLQHAKLEAAGSWSRGHLTALIALDKLMDQAQSGVATLAEGFHQYKHGPTRKKVAREDKDIANILSQVEALEPSSTQSFGFQEIKDAVDTLATRLTLLARSVSGELPEFRLEPYGRARLAGVLEHMSKNEATPPAGHESFPAVEVVLVDADFAAQGRGGVPGRYTFRIAPDDKVYVFCEDGSCKGQVWQALWPHDLAKPQR